MVAFTIDRQGQVRKERWRLTQMALKGKKRWKLIYVSHLPGSCAGRESKMNLWDVVTVCVVLLNSISTFPLPAGKRPPEKARSMLGRAEEDHTTSRLLNPYAGQMDCKHTFHFLVIFTAAYWPSPFFFLFILRWSSQLYPPTETQMGMGRWGLRKKQSRDCHCCPIAEDKLGLKAFLQISMILEAVALLFSRPASCIFL